MMQNEIIMKEKGENSVIIDSFSGEYRFLSNFYPAQFYWNGYSFPTSEHAFQMAKAIKHSDQEFVRAAPTAGQAKRRGRIIEKRPDWESIKLQVMREVVAAKFQQNLDLMLKLIETGDVELIEGNTWGDTYWGVCRGKGENHLGKILMELREHARKSS
jgi:ribA/ribD-fused uncharacterized protein